MTFKIRARIVLRMVAKFRVLVLLLKKKEIRHIRVHRVDDLEPAARVRIQLVSVMVNLFGQFNPCNGVSTNAWIMNK